jgi:hypothetical protein
VVFTTNPYLGVLEGKTNEQPPYQGYFDAESAGMRVDYADALDKSGADYLVVIAKPGEHDYRGRLDAKFEHVRDVDATVANATSLPFDSRCSPWRTYEVSPPSCPHPPSCPCTDTSHFAPLSTAIAAASFFG